MCGQFSLAADQDVLELQRMLAALRERQGALVSDALNTGHVYPSDAVPVWTADGPQAMQWGFAPDRGGRLLINARAETAAQKPTFAQLLRSSRCLIPATFFYEWLKQGRERIRYACRVPEQPLFYMAGLYRSEPEKPFPVFTILTRPAQGALAEIHDRMPVILPREALRPWLTDVDAASDILQHTVTALRLTAG